MATNAHLIIDGRSDGLPHAPAYYAAFPREPSPLGEALSLSVDRTTVLADTSLDAILDTLLKAGAGAIVVLVCHAYKQGLLVPINKDGTKALAESTNLGSLDRAMAAETEVAQIRAIPKSEDRIKRWGPFLNGLQPGAVVGAFTEKDAEAFYDKWLEMVADKLEFAGKPSRDALRKLLDKVKKVRQLKLARLELRACNIGADTAAMQVVRKYFNCTHVTAPTVGTFYMSDIPIVGTATFAEQESNGGSLGQSRTPGPLGVHSRRPAGPQVTHTARGFIQEVIRPYEFGRQPGFTSARLYRGDPILYFAFTLIMEETSAFHYRSRAYVKRADNGKPDWKFVRKFVDEAIMPSSPYSAGALPIAGLWTPSLNKMPFVLPNEPTYLRLFEKVQ